MRPLIDNVVATMKKSGGKMDLESFRELILKTRDSLFEDVDTLMELVIASGVPIDIEGDEVILKTSFIHGRKRSFVLLILRLMVVSLCDHR